MFKKLAVLVSVLIACSVNADIICSGSSALTKIDSRIEPVVDSIDISYNSAWIGGDSSAEVVIEADGTEIKRTTGEGEFAWAPTPGKHTLTYTTYIDGVAQEEVYTATVFKDWKYTVDNGEATIIETTQTSGDVVIPSEIDGLPVVGLDEGLFNGCEGIMSIVIPDSIIFIGFRLLSDLEQNDWELLEDESDDELVVYKSNDINHGGSTYMTLEVEGPLVLSFDWKVSSESGWDYLKWYLDGTEKSAISGTGRGWQTVTSSIPAGEHTIKWQYSKDGSVDNGEDCGWVRLPRILFRMQSTFEGCTNLTSITISSDFVTRLSDMFPDSYDNITSVRFTSDVIEIPDNAFAGCSALSSFNIPDDVTTIGTNAFKDCSSLTSLVIPDGVIRIAPGAFDGCTSLSSINLPDGLVDWGLDSLPPAMRSRLETYDANGFCIVNGWLIGYNNKGVSSLEVPEGVVGIGSYALSEMHNLQTLTLPQTLRYISHGAFAGNSYLDNLTIPANVESIAPEAFKDCSYLQTLMPLESVKTVGERAFEGCTQLAGVTFNDGLETISSEAFKGCWRMQYIELPLSTEEVSSSAFVGCTSLTGVTLPTRGGKMTEWFAPIYSQIQNVSVIEGEVEINSNIFARCSGLIRVSLPEGLTNIATQAFKDCTRLTEITLPSTCLNLGEEAFANCTSLRTMVLPESVERIGARVFSSCSALSTLTLSHRLTEIPDRAFAGCSSLDSFMVPASVTSLGSKIVSSGTSAIYYLGDAPSYAEDVYADAKSSLVSYVVQGTLGWDGRPNSRDIPQRWNERAITAWLANRFDVIFDAAGGTFTNVEASTYACEQVTDIAYALPPFDPVRTGYEFSGYWTAVAGGTRITSSTRVTLTKAHALYAHWTAKVPVTVRFNAVGGVVSPESSEYAAGAVYGELPVPTREHYVFKGWFTRATGGDQVTIASEVPSADHELFAHWEARRYVIRYNAGGGNGRMDAQTFNYGDTVTLRKNSFVKAHHTFAGWATVEGGEAIYADGKTLTEFTALEDGVITLYAVWSINQYSVRFDSHGGVGQMDNQTFVIGVAQKLIPCAYTRSGFKFVGWALSTTAAVSYKDCEEVKDLTPFRNATVTLYAVWEELTTPTPTPNPEPTPEPEPEPEPEPTPEPKPEPEPTPEPEPEPEPEPVKPELGKGDYSVAGDKLDGTVPETAASVYDGYLYLDNVVMGTIQAKLSKPKVNKKSGVTTAKTSVTIQINGEKKVSLKGELDLDIGEFIATDKKSDRTLILKFGLDGISGTFGKYDIDGARNFFDSKDKSEKATAEEILKPYLGAYSMILDGGILSVTIAKKGKVTIKGAIDGNKVSAKAQALIGEDMICIPVIYSKKSVNLAFTIWLPINGGDAEIIGLDDAIIGKAGTLKNGAKFIIDGDIGAFIETEDPRTLELLPDNETITVSKSKWLVADGIKPAKVAYKKGEFTITEGKKGAGIVNPSGLKLSYKSKDGSFTGSFTAYAIVKGKLKKHKATVEGILIGDVGYGTITIKKVGTWAVTIE